jgi:ankyrin repeat protein
MQKKTALHLAATSNNILAIDLLLHQPGIYLNPRSCGSDTPLHQAVRSGSIEAIRVLMSASACPMIKNALDQTVIDLAQVKKRTACKDDPDFVNLILNQIRFRVSSLCCQVI